MKSILNYVGLIFLAIFCLPYFFVKPVLKYFNIAQGNRFGDAIESFFIYMFAFSIFWITLVYFFMKYYN